MLVLVMKMMVMMMTMMMTTHTNDTRKTTYDDEKNQNSCQEAYKAMHKSVVTNFYKVFHFLPTIVSEHKVG